MTNNGNRYLIVAGGVGEKNVYIYRILKGGILSPVNTLELQSARGDLACGVIQDVNGNDYFIVAGGHGDYTYGSMFADIDVFGFNNEGTVMRIDAQQPGLSMASFDIASGVLNKRYFIAAGGYIGNSDTVCGVVDMFSIGTDGILRREKSEMLRVPTASAVSGIVSDGNGKQYFVAAGGSSVDATTNAVEVFELQDPKAQHSNAL